jgi:hypothetical protein
MKLNICNSEIYYLPLQLLTFFVANRVFSIESSLFVPHHYLQHYLYVTAFLFIKNKRLFIPSEGFSGLENKKS